MPNLKNTAVGRFEKSKTRSTSYIFLSDAEWKTLWVIQCT